MKDNISNNMSTELTKMTDDQLLLKLYKHTMQSRKESLETLLAVKGEGTLGQKYYDANQQVSFKEWLKEGDRLDNQEEKDEITDYFYLCTDELDNILYQESLDWGFDKPDDGAYETIYIYKRAESDEEDEEPSQATTWLLRRAT